MNAYEITLAALVGVALSAACGFRIFVPMLIMSIAAKSGHLQLSSGFEWIGSWPAVISFSVATVLEITAYYVPWLDNMLDTVATPAAAVAGIIVTAAAVGDVSPWLKWALAVVAGGGAATAVQVLTVTTRGTSTATTAGVGNPVVSTAEAAASTGLSVLAVLWPIIAAIVAVLLVAGIATLLRRYLRRRRLRVAAPAAATA